MSKRDDDVIMFAFTAFAALLIGLTVALAKIGERTYNTGDGTAYSFDEAVDQVVFHNGTYALGAFCANTDEINQSFAASRYQGDGWRSQIVDRTDYNLKHYMQFFPNPPAAGILIDSGTTFHAETQFRVVKAPIQSFG